MDVKPTPLEGILLIKPDVYGDRRGYFGETYNIKRYRQFGIQTDFVQDNQSLSVRNTLQGLHFQHPMDQAKLVHVIKGEVFDVAVDIRRGSPTFSHWYGTILREENHLQLLIPDGFAHGFCVLSEEAIFSYKCSEYYSPEDEIGIAWDDSDIGIEWPVKSPILSERDRFLEHLKEIPVEKLPIYNPSK